MSSKTAFPFFNGVSNTAERLTKTHRIIYGKRRLSNFSAPDSSPREKPTVENLLVHAPARQIPDIMRNAAMGNEIDINKLSTVLKTLRQYGRYDKGLAVCRAYEKETGRPILASHFVSLMTMALQSPEMLEGGGGGFATAPGGWKEALRLFNVAFVQRKNRYSLSSPSVGAGLAALNAGGLWRESIALFTRAIEDKISLESKAVHTLLFHLRNNNKWDLALRAFDTAARNGTQPNYVMYRELFYMIFDAARSSPKNAATAWEFALSAATAIETVCPPNAGLYNALIETCAVPAPVSEGEIGKPNHGENRALLKPHWEAGLRVLQHLQDRVILSAVKDRSSRTILNAQTISALSLLRLKDPLHQIKCIELSREHGLPVATDVLRRLLVALDLSSRSHEALAFVQKSLDEAVLDSSNTGLALTPLLTALVDSLAMHPDPDVALVTARHFHSSLLPVVSSSTVGCATWGDEAQSWIVEGNAKVAVIDADTLALAAEGKMPDVLLSRFDAIMVPFTCVRTLLKRLDEAPNVSPISSTITKSLHILRQLQILENPKKEGTGFVQVLPFIHHLKALGFLSSAAPTSMTKQNDSKNTLLQQLEDAQTKLLSLEQAEPKSSIKKKLKGKMFISAAAVPVSSSDNITIISSRDNEQETNQPSNVALTANAHHQSQQLQRPQQQKQFQQQPERPFWWRGEYSAAKNVFQPPSIFHWSHPTATALLLARLNPDAKITVVASCGNPLVSRCADFYGVKTVRYDELEAEVFKATGKAKQSFGKNTLKKSKHLAKSKLNNADAKEDEENSLQKQRGTETRSTDLARSATSPNVAGL